MLASFCSHRRQKNERSYFGDDSDDSSDDHDHDHGGDNNVDDEGGHRLLSYTIEDSANAAHVTQGIANDCGVSTLTLNASVNMQPANVDGTAETPRLKFKVSDDDDNVSAHTWGDDDEEEEDNAKIDDDSTDPFSKELLEAFERRRLRARMEEHSVRGVGHNTDSNPGLRTISKIEFQRWYMIGQSVQGRENNFMQLKMQQL
jgi:hypothetical protein